MMQTLEKNKNMIIAAVLFGLAIWGYSVFLKPDGTEVPVDVSTQNVGSDVLALHASLQSVAIDQSLFSSPLYKNLADFSRALENQPIGRQNPFGAIGQD